MDDHRRETRKQIMAFTLVYDKDGKLLGYLANLTHQGVMVIGEKPLEVNSPVTLDIEFSDELPGGLGRELMIAARVARCVPDVETPEEFNIGFEFTGITPEHTRIIEALLDRYHFRYKD
jgi:hypothetical protein